MADPRIAALPDIHGHAKGEHKLFAEERPIPYTARMLFLWFYHACRRSSPRFLMVADHINYLTFEDPAAVNLVRRALKLAQAGDLYGAAETAGVELGHAAVVSEGLRKGMRYSIGAEVDNDPRSRPDAQNIVDAMRPDGMVRSVHFLPIAHPQHGENWMWPFDNAEFIEFFDVVGTENVWELYMTTLLDALEKLPGHIVGHFYVPAKFGHWPDEAKLESYEDRLIDVCAERGLAVEINSRYFYKYYPEGDAQIERYRNAYLRLLRKAKAKGVMVAVGSDAHSPRDQGGAFEIVLALLDEAEVNEIAFPINGRLARVALRATEEILRRHSAALAVAAPVERAAPADGDEAESEGEETARASGSGTVLALARPRAKTKPRAAAAAGSVAVADSPPESQPPEPPAPADASTAAEEPNADGAAIALASTPRAAKSRPSRKAKAPETAEAPQADSPEATEPAGAAEPRLAEKPESPRESEPPAAAAPVETPHEPAPAPPAQPEGDMPAAASGPIVTVAENIIAAVAERAKRATTSLAEATANLLQGKLPGKAPSEPVDRPPARSQKTASAKAAKTVAKPAKKPAGKAAAKAAPAKAAPAKAAPAKAAPAKAAPAKPAAKKTASSRAGAAKAASAKKPAAKKSTGKKAASPRAGAKKAASRSATRPAAKAAKAAPARRGAVGKAKRAPAPIKRSAAKKVAAKKPAAKKKAARSRR